MNAYTQVLEFFMENGVQLSPDQMDELKTVCESGGALKKLVDGRLDKADKLQKRANALKDINTPKRNAEAKELENKIDDLRYNEIVPNSANSKYAIDANNTPSAANINRDMEEAENHVNAKRGVQYAKDLIGQGKKNMPKARQAGEYLKKQQMINDLDKEK